MKKNIERQNTRGQGLTEYILIAALIIAGVILALKASGYTLHDVYCKVGESLSGKNVCEGREIYCQDDFSTKDDWTAQYGNWEAKDGKLCTSRGAKNFNNCSQNMQNNADYTIKLSGAQIDSGNGYGIFFRGTKMDGRTNGYIVQYDPGWGGGAIIMRKWVNGRELPPFAVQRMPGFDWYGEPHDLELDVKGDTFTLWLDGEKTLVGQDDTYTEGGVGIRSWDNTQACFDNISIEEVSSETGE